MMGFSKATMMAAMGAVLASCVTINIYFPAAAAEKAADKIIDEVWQLKKDGTGTEAKPNAEERAK
jgi:hypothetical protein